MTPATSIIKKPAGLPGPATGQAMLAQSPLFTGLAPELQNTLVRQGRAKSLKKGELLFMAGDPVDSMFFLFSGKLKEYFSTEAGDICLRRVILPGNYISLHSIFMGQGVYSYTCEAIRPTDYFAWKAGNFLDLLNGEPKLGMRVATVLSGYIEDSCRLHCLCRKTQAVSRVAGFLLRQSALPSCAISGICPRRFKKTGPGVRANIRPLELSASNICLARETFSRALSVLQENGLIRTRSGEVEILDIEGLKRISGAG